MTDFASIYDDERVAISFELFPPKTDEKCEELYQTVRQLMQFEPAYFTCTYGAGGSTQGRTLEILKRVKEITSLPVASHLTCVGATRQELEEYLELAVAAGTNAIVALRGDPPKGTDTFVKPEGGFGYANELVEMIREVQAPVGIAVAGYPEVHQEAVDGPTDLANLKRKVDAGADAVITQLFYDNEDFYRFLDDCDGANIGVPIIPGILPVTNFAQAKRIANMCKARIPDDLGEAMEAADNREEEFEIGVEHARKQVLDLIDKKVPGIHLYVLNQCEAAIRMLDILQPR
ncbi:MAG: methylenetetrahydrofolate reductase [NAD(P)H] [Planctomycetota bacterium]